MSAPLKLSQRAGTGIAEGTEKEGLANLLSHKPPSSVPAYDLFQAKIEAEAFGRALSDRIRKWRKLVEKDVSPQGLTLAEFRVLVVLSESGPTSMVDLAKEQMITQAAMTSIIDHLENSEMVERDRSKTDRRVVNVTITRKGGDVLKKGMRLYTQFMKKATRNLTDEEIRTILTLFDKLLMAAQSEA
jgi:DNA-binding MarR family transcriptional regulator